LAGPISSKALDRILPRVEKPARYTGGEWNSIAKPWEDVRLRLALAFPEIYEIGMSNLGLAILYDAVNQCPDMLCERVFAPWPDMAAALRAAGMPLYALESRRPLAEFDILGFSLGYELNLTTALAMLDLAGLPLRAEGRDDTMPLVIAGGTACFNPEPFADFFDLLVIGDGEESLPELCALYADFLQESGARSQEPEARREFRGEILAGGGRPWAGGRELRRRFLRRAAKLPGVYVPEFYRARYGADGRFLALEPIEPEAPERVQTRVVRPLPPPPTRPIVPYLEPVHDRAVVEIRRGCGQGCRFCQAGMIYRPVRERPVDEIVRAAEAIIAKTGYDELGLLSLSSCDYRQIEALLARLLERFAGKVAISLPSLRVDSFSLKLAEMVQERRRSGLTFAPEAGTQRLRNAINKRVTEENLFEVAEAAFSRHWQRLKLYFMIGLPTETDEDVDGITALGRRVLNIGRQHHGKRTRVGISVSTFVPKPHTPFQWSPLADDETLRWRQGILREGLRKPGIELSWHDPRMTYLEAMLARGDRRLAPVIERAYRLGAVFDAWDEHFRWPAWQRALEECGVNGDDFARRERALDEVLPWDFVDTGVRRAHLEREYRRALARQITPDCFQSCSFCGVSEVHDVACGE